jgi:glyoxylase-like metal-dependent hydrolase (beta-lactamase superfamily II)
MEISPEPSGQDDTVADRVADVLKSLDARKFIFRIVAHGARWEPLQALRPEGPPLEPSDFDLTAVHDLAKDRMCLSWTRNFLEPLTGTVVYDERIVGKEGFISGADVALHPVPARGMTSDRLAAVRRQQHLLNPHLIVGDALQREGESGTKIMRYVGQENIGGTAHGKVEIDAFPRPIYIYINLISNQVSHVATQENDYPRGDVDVVVRYADWRIHDGLNMPHMVELCLDGVVVHSEVRARVEINPQLDAEIFTLSEKLPFDPLLAARGLINGQWMHRALAMGAPISLDAGKVEVVEITTDVISLGGGIHHSIAIALKSGVVVVDPPQHEERSLAVIEAVKSKWPDKPISHCILTHHHHDHSGGIRAYAAIGAELIVAEGDRTFIDKCLTRPHTIVPDSLSAIDIEPTVITVGDKHISLGGGEIEAHRISSPHSAEDLVVYVAGPKLLFNADLFNPGLVPAGVTPPPYWIAYSRDFRRKVEALNLDIELLIGAHGALEGRPYQSLVDFTECTEGTKP